MNLYINPDDFSDIKPKFGNQQYDANLIGFIPNVPWAFSLNAVVKEKNKVPITKILQRKLHYHQVYFKSLAKILINGEFDKLTMDKIKYVLRKIYLEEFDPEDFDPLDIQIARKAEQEYDILGGSLDIDQLLHSIEEMFGKVTIQENAGLVDFCVRELPRFLDRYVLALSVLKSDSKLDPLRE